MTFVSGSISSNSAVKDCFAYSAVSKKLGGVSCSSADAWASAYVCEHNWPSL